MSELSELFKESDTQLGVFYPKHYLIAAFPNLVDAQRAVGKLNLAGFGDGEAFAIGGKELIELAKEETGFVSFLMQAASRFFATEQISNDQDLKRAEHGAAFVAVYSPTEQAKQGAWRILEPEHSLAARYYGAAGVEHLAGDLTTN